jgi:HK97 family phage major capsid protein|tara:strand:- start:138 stop:1346 length:1209 start_codon:yes stop_codon:yes gene_type:complete
MKSIELKELRSETLGELEVIQKTAEAEDNRDLTEEENTTVDALLAKADDYSTKIERAEKMETIKRNAAVVSGVTATNESKELGDYSFQDAMKQAVSGRMTGIVKEMDAEARRENPYQSFRGIAIPRSVLEYRQATTSSSNPTEVQSFSDQLEANLVLASAGANYYSAVADQKFPIVQSISSTWANETSSTISAAGSTTSLTLSPKKLISIVQMSAEAMQQNAGLEAAIRRNMAASIASSIEAALLGYGDTGNAPESIFADCATTNTGVTAADFIGLEATVLGNDVPLDGARMAYIFDKDAYSSIRVLLQTAGVAALWNPKDKELNNYFGFFSTNCGQGGTGGKAHCLFGDFSRVHIAQFGGLDMLWDPYTNAASGLGRLVATSLVDGNAVDNTTAFANIIES